MPSFETTYEQDKWDNLVKQAEDTTRKIRTKKGKKEDLELISKIMEEYGHDSVLEDFAKTAKSKAKRKVSQKKVRSRTDQEFQYIKELERILQQESDTLANLLESYFKEVLERLDDLQELGESIKDDTEEILDILRDNGDDDGDDDGGGGPDDDDDDFTGSPTSRVAKKGETPEELVAGLFDDVEDSFDNLLNEKFGGGTGNDFFGSGFVDNTLGFVGSPTGPDHYVNELQNHNDDMADVLSKLSDLDLTDGERDKAEKEKATTWIRAMKASWLGKSLGTAYNKGSSFFSGMLSLLGRFLANSLLSGKLFDALDKYLDLGKVSEMGIAFYNDLKSRTQELVRYISEHLNFESVADNAKEAGSAAVDYVKSGGLFTGGLFDLAKGSWENRGKFWGGKGKDEEEDEKDSFTGGSAAAAASGSASVDSPVRPETNTFNETDDSTTFSPDVSATANYTDVGGSSVIHGSTSNVNPRTSLNPTFSIDNNASYGDINVPTTRPAESGFVVPGISSSPSTTQQQQGAGMQVSSVPNLSMIPTTSPDTGLGILNAGALVS